EDESEWPAVRERLACLPGIENFSLARHAALDLDAITRAVVEHLPDRPVQSFRIRGRRADKRFPTPTPGIERPIGRHGQGERGWNVNRTSTELVITVEVLASEAFSSYGREGGAGGGPIGTGGRVMTLLSGGIDSPVAAWRIVRRGSRSDFVHFH